MIGRSTVAPNEVTVLIGEYSLVRGAKRQDSGSWSFTNHPRDEPPSIVSSFRPEVEPYFFGFDPHSALIIGGAANLKGSGTGPRVKGELAD